MGWTAKEGGCTKAQGAEKKQDLPRDYVKSSLMEQGLGWKGDGT